MLSWLDVLSLLQRRHGEREPVQMLSNRITSRTIVRATIVKSERRNQTEEGDLGSRVRKHTA